MTTSVGYACVLAGALTAGARLAAAADLNPGSESELASSIFESGFSDDSASPGGDRHFLDAGAAPACELATGWETVEPSFRPFAAEEHVETVTPLPPLLPQAVQPPLENPASMVQFLQEVPPRSDTSNASDYSRPGLLSAGPTGGAWFGGAEVALLHPFAGELTELGLNVPVLNVGLLSSKPSYQMSACPRVWVGYTSAEGTGVRVRYWQFDHALSGEASDVFPNGNLPLGSRRVSQGRLNIYSIDVEASQKIRLQQFTIYGRAGMCIAGLEQNRSLTYIIPNRSDTTLGSLGSFTGIGPTVGAELFRPLGESNFTFVASSRGAMLFGQRTRAIYVSRELTMAGLSQPAFNLYTRTENELYASEIRMGMQYDKTLKSGRQIFGRLMWENQFWAGSGSGLAGVGLTGIAIGLGTAR